MAFGIEELSVICGAGSELSVSLQRNAGGGTETALPDPIVPERRVANLNDQQGRRWVYQRRVGPRSAGHDGEIGVGRLRRDGDDLRAGRDGRAERAAQLADDRQAPSDRVAVAELGVHLVAQVLGGRLHHLEAGQVPQGVLDQVRDLDITITTTAVHNFVKRSACRGCAVVPIDSGDRRPNTDQSHGGRSMT